MSTRYVWDKTVAATVYTARLLNEDAYESSATFLTFGKAYNLNKSTGEFSLVEPVTYHPGYNQGMDIDFVGAYVMAGEQNKKRFMSYAPPDSYPSDTYEWYVRTSTGSDGAQNISVSIRNKTNYSVGGGKRYRSEETVGSGAHVGYLSGGNRNAYTSGIDGTGEYYLVYLGSDSIDPKNISFLTTEPDINGRITVEVSPATGTLGGNILYQYQYSTDNGESWVNAGDKTAAKQKEISVPSDAEKIMVRVQASDDTGFTSTTYVSTGNIDVQTMHLWVGVSGVSHQGRKLWIGVNGVARPVVRAWVGDENGKARRWF